jgi:hypothetical protein
MDNISKIVMVVGIGLIFVTMVMVVLGLGDATTVSVFGSMGVALLVVTLVKNWKLSRGEVLQDERTREIHNRALSFSWWLAYLTITAVFLLDYSGVAHFTIDSFALVMIFFMLISYWVVRRYLSWKGEA